MGPKIQKQAKKPPKFSPTPIKVLKINIKDIDFEHAQNDLISVGNLIKNFDIVLIILILYLFLWLLNV